MKLVLWGLLLLFVDFSIYFGTSAVDCLPDFVGYILIAVGLSRVEQCAVYQKAAFPTKIAAGYSAVVWVLNLAGLYGSFLSAVLSLVSMVVFLLVSYRITKGVRELEATYNYQMNGKSLMTAWIVVAVWAVLNELALWTGGDGLIIIGTLAGLAFDLYYLLQYNKSRKEFLERLEWQED